MKLLLTVFIFLCYCSCFSQITIQIGNGAGGGGTTDTTSLSNRINYKQTVFNVKQYGAVGDSTTNDQVAIQAAINACFDAGGGKVYFPDGKYRLGGALVTSGTLIGNPNSLLYIKQKSLLDATGLITIELVGDVAPNPTFSALTDYTTIRKGATIIADPSSVSGTFPAILGADPGVIGSYNMNYGVNVRVENLNFLIKARVGAGGPNMCGLNLKRVGNAIVNNNVIVVDTALLRTSYPTAETFGVYMSATDNGTITEANSNVIGGFKYGLVIAEHFSGKGNEIVVCEYGLVVEQTNHGIQIDNIGMHWVKHAVSGKVGSITGGGAMSNKTSITIDGMNTEYRVNGSWFDTRYVIADSLNMLYGKMGYTIVQASVGLNDTLINGNGGENLSVYANSTNGTTRVSSASTLNLLHGVSYIFTGTTATYSMPSPRSILTGQRNKIVIKNRGSGSITLNGTLYDTAVTGSITIIAGATAELLPDGTYFNILYNQ